MGGEELRAEFERLGEVAVIERIMKGTYDRYRRAYALRWLSDHALARVQKEETALNRRLAAAKAVRPDLRLTLLAVVAIFVLVAALIWLKTHGGAPFFS
jgi:uncharacterized membrane protein